MKALYDGYRETEYTLLREKYEPGYKSRNAVLKAGVGYTADIEMFLSPHLVFPVSILDWGGDTGKNTPLKSRNKLFHVYDISNKLKMLDGAERINISVAFKSHHDLIICANVLGHSPFPLDILSSIKQLMHSGTVLYVEIPLEDIVRICNGKTCLRKKKYWHEHVNICSETSIKALLMSAGLEVIDFQLLDANAESNASCRMQVACVKS